MKAVIYIRTFTEDPDDVNNLIKQNTEPKKLIVNQGYIYQKTYSDSDCSGKTAIDDRIGLSVLLNHAKEKKFDILVIYSINVLAQTRELLKEIYSKLVELQIKVVSCAENLDSLDILQVVKKQVRISDLIPKFVPFGYKRDGIKILIEENKANTVRLIFKLHCVDLHNVHQITKLLNEKELPTPRNNFKWSDNVVKGIIDNKYKYDGGIIGEAEETVVRWPKILQDTHVLPRKTVKKVYQTIDR